MAPATFAEAMALAIAAALVMGAAVTAWSATSVAKRVVAVLIALIAAALALGVVGASSAVVVGAVALAFAYVVVGVSLLVRMQEAYGAAETPEIDAADDRDEPAEPSA
jgi:hypothetical protein